eukprot:TRINITY_DN29215_c0_g1_i2.p1 TRINITY_DN29215_c0_g1~~TRINITY_DN29215_c0_g1_i2.p1  ORF type:complete len:345 (-),score=38.38 TRINITY_DN29215_c0_g1_i2:37-1011(-)
MMEVQFLCNECYRLRNVCSIMQLLVQYAIQDNEDVDLLASHLAVVNELPENVAGTSALRIEWMQEVYNLAYSLYIIANGIQGWKVITSPEIEINFKKQCSLQQHLAPKNAETRKIEKSSEQSKIQRKLDQIKQRLHKDEVGENDDNRSMSVKKRRVSVAQRNENGKHIENINEKPRNNENIVAHSSQQESKESDDESKDEVIEEIDTDNSQDEIDSDNSQEKIEADINSEKEEEEAVNVDDGQRTSKYSNQKGISKQEILNRQGENNVGVHRRRLATKLVQRLKRQQRGFNLVQKVSSGIQKLQKQNVVRARKQKKRLISQVNH